jgi:hypothetical protein
MARESPLRPRDIFELLARRRCRSIISFDRGDAPLLAHPAIGQRHSLDHNCD